MKNVLAVKKKNWTSATVGLRFNVKKLKFRTDFEMVLFQQRRRMLAFITAKAPGSGGMSQNVLGYELLRVPYFGLRLVSVSDNKPILSGS